MAKTKNKPKCDSKAADLDGKVQVKDQESAGDMSQDVKPEGTAEGGTSGEIQEVKEPKAAINTRKAAEVVTDGSISNNGFGAAVLRSRAISFSGGAGDIRGDMSATTKEDKPYRSGDRAGRRADSTLRKIDALRAEIFKTVMHQSAPLDESDSPVGYMGNYYNDHVITQRLSGGTPNDPLFERSLDEIDLDMIYLPFGQYIFTNDDQRKLIIPDWNVDTEEYKTPNIEVPVGNFLPRTMTVVFTETGVKSMAFDVEDIAPKNVDEQTYRASSDAFLRFQNQSELDRNIIISKAGNESETGWSPLGDSIPNVSDQNRFLYYLDNLTTLLYLSKRKLSSAYSYQINKVAKDGLRLTGPMLEMVNGLVPVKDQGGDHAVNERNNVVNDLFYNYDTLSKGNAAFYVAINDSVTKYGTKGKLLTLPLSFKTALQIADSNDEPLRMHPLLKTLMEKHELFSTIDGPYDPLKPVVVTDKAMITLPINPFFGFSVDNYIENSKVYTMHFENLRNKYDIDIHNYFAHGIYAFFRDHASRCFEALDKAYFKTNQDHEDEYTLTVPIISSTTTFSLWDLIVCASTPYMIKERLTSLTPLLKYERINGYPYSNSIEIPGADECAQAENYGFKSIDEPISVGVAKPIPALKVLLPEVFWPIHKEAGEATQKKGLGYPNGAAVYTVLPFYFNQNQFRYDTTVMTENTRLLLARDHNFACVSYPSTREGTNYAFMDTIYSMSEDDFRLALDRMTVYPGYEFPNNTGKIARGSGNNKIAALAYKYGLTTDGIPVIPYFGHANDADHKDCTLTILDVLRTPRELGLMMVAPQGVLSPKKTSNGFAYADVADSYLSKSGPGFRLKYYYAAKWGTTPANDILTEGSKSISNNDAYMYIWNMVCATPSSVNRDAEIGLSIAANGGMDNTFTPFTVNSYSDGFGDYDENQGTFNDNAEEQLDDNDFKIHSAQRYIWTRLQRLPFIVNPFDCNYSEITNDTKADLNTRDIYDFLYYFGFCGFRASDYSALVYQRSKMRIAKGMNYVQDPFIERTILLK